MIERTVGATDAIHDGMTINEAIRRWPATVAIFHLLGLDACCGGGLPIREAAGRHGLVAEDVMTMLRRTL